MEVVLALMSRAMIVALLALSACGDPTLEKRVTELEGQVKDLQTQVAASKGKSATPATAAPDSPDEQAANDLFRQANVASQAGKYDDAKAALATLNSKYPDSKAAKRSDRMKGELALIGSDAGTLDVASWYQGKASMTDGKATLLVFFEEWCPHCNDEMPKIQATYDKFHPKGLNVVGLTKLTRGATDDKVGLFITNHKMTFPVGKEKDGSMSQKYNVQGIPAAAVIKDGKVMWRGHPGTLTEDMITGFLG